jgi:hypothetical protein
VGAAFLDSFARSAWRLETLSVYNPRSDAAYRHFAATGEVLPLDQRPGKQAWLAGIREAVAAGKRLTQLHVVDRPLSAYLRYELAVYPENVAAGMAIRIADRTSHPELAPLDRDFWLLDDETDRPVAQLMTYDPDGEYVSREVTSEAAVLARCRAQRDLALGCSVTLAEFFQAAGEPLR